jgi:hypothetical protein
MPIVYHHAIVIIIITNTSVLPSVQQAQSGVSPSVHVHVRWPYLRNLPKKFGSMPIFYNSSEFGSIQIPSFMKRVQVNALSQLADTRLVCGTKC